MYDVAKENDCLLVEGTVDDSFLLPFSTDVPSPQRFIGVSIHLLSG